MIVFGHYAISLQSFDASQLPPSLNPGNGARIEQIVRVVHLMFIPVFPFEKTWVLKKDGKRYNLPPEIHRAIEGHLHSKPMPWYAFSFLILAAVALTIFRVNGSLKQRSYEKAAFESRIKNTAERFEKIQRPSNMDYYEFSNNKGDVRFAKVHRFTQDSIVFMVAKQNDGKFWDDGWKVGYFDNPNSNVVLVSNHKERIKSTVRADENNFFEGAALEGILTGSKVVLNDIKRLDRDKLTVQYEDAKEAQLVKAAFDNFMSSYANIDSSLMFIDSASVSYFRQVLSMAKSPNFITKKEFIESSKFPLETYKNMLYTQYSYLETTKKQKAANEKEELKDYGFYLKLLEMGLWILDFDKKVIGNVHTNGISFQSPTAATIQVAAPSNMLNLPRKIEFRVKMNKENGTWKLNVPSTYDYTTYQIQGGVKGANYRQAYRKIVREEIKNLEQSVQLASEWEY